LDALGNQRQVQECAGSGCDGRRGRGRRYWHGWSRRGRCDRGRGAGSQRRCERHDVGRALPPVGSTILDLETDVRCPRDITTNSRRLGDSICGRDDCCGPGKPPYPSIERDGILRAGRHNPRQRIPHLCCAPFKPQPFRSCHVQQDRYGPRRRVVAGLVQESHLDRMGSIRIGKTPADRSGIRLWFGEDLNAIQIEIGHPLEESAPLQAVWRIGSQTSTSS